MDLPESATETKLAAIRRFGSEMVVHGSAWDDANALAMKVAGDSGRAYIHPFDNPMVMAGQGTIVTELLAQLPEPDLIVTSIGGGGLISGILSAVQHYSPSTRVFGVETRGRIPCTRAESRQIVELQAITSIAETSAHAKTEQNQSKSSCNTYRSGHRIR